MTTSTMGTISYQKDDGDDEVTSGLKQQPEQELFEEIKKEMEDENTFARKNNMNPIYWCWNCQHSECDQH